MSSGPTTKITILISARLDSCDYTAILIEAKRVEKAGKGSGAASYEG